MEKFPKFTESGFYKEWLKGVAMFPQITEAQKIDTLRMAWALYCRVKLRSDGSGDDYAPGAPHF